MSNAGLGAFVQGLAQGYQIGDKLQTNEQEREFRGLQINKAKSDLERQGRIDAARANLVGKARQLIEKPDDPEVLSGYRQAMIDYGAEENPDKILEYRKTFRNEDIDATARKVAPVIRGLLSGDQNSISEAAKLNGFIPNGREIDPSGSSIDPKTGNVTFAMFKTDTGEKLPAVTMTPQQIILKGLGHMSSPDEFFKTAALLQEKKEDRDVKVYGINTEANTAATRTRVLEKGQEGTNAYHQELLNERKLGNDLGEIKTFYNSAIANIRKNVDAATDEKVLNRMMDDEQSKAGYAEAVIRKNAPFNVRVSPYEIYRDAPKYMSGQIKLREAKDHPGWGITPQGFIVPVSPRQKLESN